MIARLRSACRLWEAGRRDRLGCRRWERGRDALARRVRAVR